MNSWAAIIGRPDLMGGLGGETTELDPYVAAQMGVSANANMQGRISALLLALGGLALVGFYVWTRDQQG